MKPAGLAQFKVHSRSIVLLPYNGNSVRFFFDLSPQNVLAGIILVYVILLFANYRALLSFRPPFVFVLATCSLTLLFGIFIAIRNKPQNNKSHYMNGYKPGMALKIEVREDLKHNDFFYKYKGTVSGLGKEKSTGDVLIRIRKTPAAIPLAYGDIIWTKQHLSEFNEVLNPGAFDFKEFSKRKGIYHQITLSKDQFIRKLSDKFTIRSKALKLRESISMSLKTQGFSKKELSVIEALLLGNKQDLSQETFKAYQQAGAVHILAISGLHIGILLLILQVAYAPLDRLRSGKRIKWGLLVLSLWAFAFLTGLSASVVRAVGMFTLLAIGKISGRRSSVDHYLFSALFLSLLFDPFNVFDVGFQLSYSAVLSIIAIGPTIKTLWNPRHKLPEYFWNLIVISIAAQLGVLPLTLYYFNQFSGLFLLSGILIIPLLGVVLGMGFFMIILDQLAAIPRIYVQLYGHVIASMNKAIDLMGHLEVFVFEAVFFTAILLLISYALVLSGVNFVRHQSGKGLTAFLICGIILYATLIIEKRSVQTFSTFIVFHNYRSSLFLRQFGDKGFVFSSDLDKVSNSTILDDYRLKFFSLETIPIKDWQNFFKTSGKRVMILEHSSSKHVLEFKPKVLIIINSPRINLERILQDFQPETIVADGSNFTSYKSMWQRTAQKYGVEFHDTAVRGAFTL